MSFIYVPFSYLMKFCLMISGQYYVIALFFFALLIQILLVFFSIKQQKSQIAMAKVKPMEMAIREKYKGRNDQATQQKMAMEIQDMYQQNGYSPFSGCLPLLIQLPIIFILFAIVREPIRYSSDLIKDNPDFITHNAETVINFYEKEKEALDKDSYVSEDEYYEVIAEIEKRQMELGAKKEKAEDGKEYFKYDKLAAYSDMDLAKFIVDGKEELQELIDENHISKDFMAKYNELGLEQYKEELPKFDVFGVSLLNKPSFSRNYWLLLVPLLVFLTSVLSTKITQKTSAAAAPTGANGKPAGGGLFMEVGMPLISAIITFTMSAAVGVYWIWRTVIGIGERLIISKAMPIPAVTEEQIAEAKRQLKGSRKKKKRITIEVDEDDNTYSDIEVKNASSSSMMNSDGAKEEVRAPRKIEMLTCDDDEIPEKDKKDGKNASEDKNGSKK